MTSDEARQEENARACENQRDAKESGVFDGSWAGWRHESDFRQFVVFIGPVSWPNEIQNLMPKQSRSQWDFGGELFPVETSSPAPSAAAAAPAQPARKILSVS